METDNATWMLGKERPFFLLPSVGVKSYFSEGRFLSIIILNMTVTIRTAIGSEVNTNIFPDLLRKIFSKNNE